MYLVQWVALSLKLNLADNFWMERINKIIKKTEIRLALEPNAI